LPAELIICPATASDLAIATQWLQAAGLPVADLTPEHMGNFLLAKRGGMPVAMAGLELFTRAARIGLLRSLVVDPSCRGAGIGSKLVAALEAAAVERQLRELWLLTIDADAFFAKLGYVATARAAAPGAIQATAEFRSLFPGDAVLMYKPLA
jgi:N-acetylglutamate synthase-like GNAT family acetyltransferase